jgi:hypothetical protein
LLDVNQEILNVVYAFGSNIKLLLFRKYLEEIKNLKKQIAENLKPGILKQSEKGQKGICVLFKTVFVLVMVSYVTDSFVFISSLTSSGWKFVLDSFLYFCILISYVLGGFTNTGIQATYYVFCLMIYAMLKQLEDEFVELNQTRHDKETKATIKKLVTSHCKIIEVSHKVSFCCHQIIELVFVSSIFFLGVTLISTQKFDWFRLFATIPFILFDAWILCYSSQMVIDQVRFLLQFWLSITLRFYSTVPQHVSETLRHQLG